jgi:hypothetical protein
MMRTAKVGAIDDQVWSERDGSVVRTPYQRRRRAVASVLLVLVGLGIAYVPVAMVLSRWECGTIAFWKPPDRIDYCGRRYDQGSITLPGTPASLTASFKAPRVQWSEVERTFSLQPIYASVLTRHPNSAVCAMFLYVPAGHGQWWTYSLSGGP